jgi:hypothetical protein
MPAQLSIAAAAVLLCFPAVCAAAEWSDTALSWRIGNRFREPFNPLDIHKNIFADPRQRLQIRQQLLQCRSAAIRRQRSRFADAARRRPGSLRAVPPHARHRQAAWRRPVLRTDLVIQADARHVPGTSSGTTSSVIPPRQPAGGASAPARRWCAPKCISETNWRWEIHPRRLLANVNSALPETPRYIPCINLPNLIR